MDRFTKHRIGKIQKKIILLLLAGVALGLSGSPRQQFYIVKKVRKAWRDIDKKQLKRSLTTLHEAGVVKTERRSDGSMKIILTRKGKRTAKEYTLDQLEIQEPPQWDKKWRIVIFDIPERKKKFREIFRQHLQHLNFRELQKSVFIHPYDCAGEIEFLIDFYHAKSFVRFIIADSINFEDHLLRKFKLM